MRQSCVLQSRRGLSYACKSWKTRYICGDQDTELWGQAIKTIGEVAHGRDNNFNLLRVLAATAVLISHSWPLALGPATLEPFQAATGYKLGTTAVVIFFAISGFFITKSFDRRISITDFVFARIARLYPALIVATVFTAFFLGPLLSSLSAGRYLQNLLTWTFVLHSLALIHVQWTLPGVFTTNIYPDAVNGSLWTLLIEVQCYTMVAIAGFFRLIRPRYFPVFAVLFAICQIYFRWHDIAASKNNFALLSLPFFIGMVCYVYRALIPLSGVLAIALMGLVVMTVATPLLNMTYPVAVAYASLWFGLAKVPFARRYNHVGDYSYGIYIYAFPIQQMIVALIGSVGPWQLIAFAMPVTLAMAFLSWTLVERPSLDHRHFVIARARGSVLACWSLLGRKDGAHD